MVSWIFHNNLRLQAISDVALLVCEREVSRNVATPGGTIAAISVMRASAMTPGPLGISDTSPSAEAPPHTAKCDSSTETIQHIFTRGRRIPSNLRLLSVAFHACHSMRLLVKTAPEKTRSPGGYLAWVVLSCFGVNQTNGNTVDKTMAARGVAGAAGEYDAVRIACTGVGWVPVNARV
jgi:hypothetical protein